MVKISIRFLVVVTIIGILAFVVAASLNTTRNKRADAAAISGLDSARAQSELYYDNNRTYTTVCTTGTNNISTLLTSVSDAVAANAVCFDAEKSWAASIDLNGTGKENFYCVDGAGFGGILTADPGLSDTNTTCN